MNRGALVGIARDWGLSLLLTIAVFAGWTFFFSPQPLSGGEAPGFTLDRIDGGTVRLADHAGEVTVLNFWATWCGPCKQEIPDFSEFHADHPDVPLYGISVDANMPAGRIHSLAKRYGATYPILHDRQGTASDAYNVTVLPTTVIVGSSGDIVSVHVGQLSREGLAELVASASDS